MRLNVGGSGSAGVNDEAGVFDGYLRAADFEAFEAGLLY
jgi:hypothetical protein